MKEEEIKIETIEIPEILKKEYIKLADKLIKRDILKEEDMPAFKLMFYHYIVSLKAIEKIIKYGIVFKDRKIVRKNPAIQIFRDNSRLFYDYASQFGLLPADRRNKFLLDIFPELNPPDINIPELTKEEDINNIE